MLLKNNIESDRLLMRSINPSEDNLSNYLRWMRDRESNTFIAGIDPNMSIIDLKKYIAHKNASDCALLVGLFDKVHLMHIGNIKLEPIQETEACLGILIGEEGYRGRSIGFESISRILAYSKEQLRLNRIYLGLKPDNLKAWKLYTRLGFRNISDKKGLSDRIEMEIVL